MATNTYPCPACGSAETRPLTRKEWRDRNGGRDAVVVAMPLICAACGQVWDVPLSRRTCYFVAALSAAACLICGTVFVASAAALVWAVFIREGPAGGQRLGPVITVAGASLVGAVGTGIATRNYLRRVRAARE